MSFPPGTPVKTLTGTISSAVAGTAYRGKVVLTPSAYLIDSSRNAVYPGGGAVDLDAEGHFSVDVLPCDAAGVQPAGWRWLIDIQPTGAKRIPPYYANLTGTGTIDLADVTPVPAPGGGTGGGGGGAVSSVNGEVGVVVLDAADVGADAAGAATAAVAGHAAATDPHGDRAAATAALTAHEADTTSVHGIADTSNLETQAGAQSKANAAQDGATSAASADATSKVSTHSAALDPHGDRAWASGQFTGKAANLGDLASAATARTNLGLGNAATRAVGTTEGTVAAGDDPRFSGGGGGSIIRWAEARISDGAVVDLASAPSWTIVATSVGTQLKCSIAAQAGDRIGAEVLMLNSGTRFYDIALLSSGGAIAVYDSSGTSSPSSEGSPWMYYNTSFPRIPGSARFTVGSGHLSGGLATVALVNQGTSTAKVYAFAGYPWIMRLANLGPEPA